MIPEAVWRIGERDRAAEDFLMEELGIPRLLAAVLVRRGMGDAKVARTFLNPSLEELHDPRLLPDFDKALAVIKHAKESGEMIYVHGDYDVDGVSSTALMTRFLKAIGCVVVPHVPHRMKEGYGIHIDAVRWAKEQGASLFLTCDCGITAHEQLEAVYEMGMKALVTDHHEPKATLPRAEAVVNPHRADSKYPFAELAGAGVVFKLCQGIAEELGEKVENYWRAYLDMAVLGTVADVMPLVGENRIITRHGLGRLKESKKVGVQELLKVSELDGFGVELVSRHIGFQLGPRINAVGRIDDASVALDLFLTKDQNLARNLAEFLDRRNQARRDEQKVMLEKAMEIVESRRLYENYVMVVADKGWQPGIIGIVAGKLTEHYRRPTFVIAVDEDGKGKGSARSIPGFSLAEAIRRHEELLVSGGGHELAAGVSILEEKVGEFGQRLDAYARGFMKEEDFAKVVEIEAEITLEEADGMAIDSLEALQPYGEMNPEPVFAVRGASLGMVTPTRKPEHVRVKFVQDGVVRDAMAFGCGEAFSAMEAGTEMDLALKLSMNSWKGRKTPQIVVEDYRVRR